MSETPPIVGGFVRFPRQMSHSEAPRTTCECCERLKENLRVVPHVVRLVGCLRTCLTTRPSLRQTVLTTSDKMTTRRPSGTTTRTCRRSTSTPSPTETPPTSSGTGARAPTSPRLNNGNFRQASTRQKVPVPARRASVWSRNKKQGILPK